MARNWTVYTGGPTAVHRDQISVSLNTRGELVLNRFAYEAFDRPEAVVALFSEKTDEIGLRPCGVRTLNALRLRLKGDRDNYVVRIKPFCVEENISLDHTVRFRGAAIEEGILVLDLNKRTDISRGPRGPRKPRNR